MITQVEREQLPEWKRGKKTRVPDTSGSRGYCTVT
jgi:hypothetical protein